jgi:hypothetical protein
MLQNLRDSKIKPITRNRKSYFVRKANTTTELQKLVETAMVLDMAITIRFHGAISINANNQKVLTRGQYAAQSSKPHVVQAQFDDWKGHHADLSAFVYSVPAKYPKTKVLIMNAWSTLNTKVMENTFIEANHRTNFAPQTGVLIDPDHTEDEAADEGTWRFSVDFFTAHPFTDSDIDTSEWLQIDNVIIPFGK